MIAFLRQTCAPRALLLALLILGLGVDAAVSHGQSVAGGAVVAMADESAPTPPYDHRNHGEEASKRRPRHILELRIRDAGDDVHTLAANIMLPAAGKPDALDPVLPPATSPYRDAGLSGQPRLRLKLQLGQAP